MSNNFPFSVNNLTPVISQQQMLQQQMLQQQMLQQQMLQEQILQQQISQQQMLQEQILQQQMLQEQMLQPVFIPYRCRSCLKLMKSPHDLNIPCVTRFFTCDHIHHVNIGYYD